MMLPILGCLGFVLISLIVSIILVFRLIIICIMVGFKKGIKSKEAIIILLLVPLLIGASAYCFYSLFAPYSGEKIIKAYLLNPVPKSVEIIDSYDGGPDLVPDTCLHFKIAPADFKLLLNAKKWELVNDTKYSGIQCDYQNSAWNFSFPPPALGDKVKTYYFSPYNKDYEYLFVNAQMNEVYFFNIDSGLP